MPVAAVPQYLGHNFSEASPGLRFGLYLPVWMSRADQEQEVRDRAKKRSSEGQEIAARVEAEGMERVIAELEQAGKNPLTRCWHKSRKQSDTAWDKVVDLTPDDRQRCQALVQRQRALAEPLAADGQMLVLEARSTAPFTTGLGNEHPLENGFAFLNPYGLPYLAGSGLKGVLRNAARELASGEWGETSGWNEETISLLFGSEDSDNARRGALIFWDVIPLIRGGKLAVEVMTGHQSHYYQKGESPHDAKSPNPVFFLTVPAGAEFNFYVQCDRTFLCRIAPTLAEDDCWKALLEAAFAHAFAWLGFGAKTAVGYGAMEIDARKQELARQQREAEAARRRAEAEERARQEAEQQEKARKQAEFDALSDEKKLLTQLEDLLEQIGAAPEIARDPLIADFNGLRKTLEQEGPGWPEQADREQGAELLERFYDLTGWHQSGIKADKRKKQEKKKRDQIARLRAGG